MLPGRWRVDPLNVEKLMRGSAEATSAHAVARAYAGAAAHRESKQEGRQSAARGPGGASDKAGRAAAHPDDEYLRRSEPDWVYRLGRCSWCLGGEGGATHNAAHLLRRLGGVRRRVTKVAAPARAEVGHHATDR